MAEPRVVRVPALLDSVSVLATAAREEGEAAGLGADALIELELAVVEASNNIVAHGYDGAAGEIEMRALRDAGLIVELIDTGRPIPVGLLENPPMVDVEAERGRGLAIIRSCVDRLDYTRAGGANCLRLFKARG